MSSRGRVIVLNGTSSSGKSTLVRALQARLDGPWLGVGIDTVVYALPKAYLDLPGWADVFRYVPAESGSPAPFRIETGELGHRLIEGMHGMVASLADAGLSVIVDHVLLEPEWLPDLAATARRATRCCSSASGARSTSSWRARRPAKDRTIGQAAAQFDVVHRAGGYDLEVDTSELDAGRGGRHGSPAPIESGFPTTPFGQVDEPAG